MINPDLSGYAARAVGGAARSASESVNGLDERKAMGIYSEYLEKKMAFQDLTSNRKLQLKQVSALRKRDILVYACDASKGGRAPIGIEYDDLLPISDQLGNLSGSGLDVILETVGGSGEIAEDIVRMLRKKYPSVAFIVPGMAKSAGTIMVMAGDEILMDHTSSLGPIDAQIQWEGKRFSAEAFLKGLEQIKKDATESKSLNRAYIPILQRISPGEIQNADNALKFARVLVSEWLSKYKFKFWEKHRDGRPVTDDDKVARAEEIAQALCDHSRWLSHGRSIKLEDLESLGLKVTDYGKIPQLSDAIRRYHVLLQMTLGQSNIFKLIETPTSQIYRHVEISMAPAGVPPAQAEAAAVGALVQVSCAKCKKSQTLQADFDNLKPLQPGAVRFPINDILICGQCGTNINLSQLRHQIEIQTKKSVVRK